MRVCVLTGAGISAESGVPTFRDSNGLWEGHDVQEVATPEGFARNPDLVYRFYNERRAALAGVEPHEGHKALYRLEQALGDDFLLVTQNVDDLHDRCGHDRLLHMHGELLAARNAFGDVLPWTGPFDASDLCPNTGTRLRPHVVWFGEMPLYMDEIEQFVTSCDVFWSIGTSGQVYPAAGFSALARSSGAHCVEINLAATGGGNFHEVQTGPASIVVPRLVDEILASR